MATKPRPAGDLPNTWVGDWVEVSTDIGTFRGRLVAIAPVRHDVTISLDNGNDGVPTRITVPSDHLVNKS